jgi:hypothetical protein
VAVSSAKTAGRVVLQAGAEEGLVGHHAVLDLEVVGTAGRVGAHAQAHLQVVVGLEAGEAVALQDQLQLAGLQVQQVHVVPARVTVVDAHQHLVQALLRAADHAHAHLVEGRVVALRAGLHVDAVKAEVLVAGVVLDEQQLLAVARPEVAGNGAVLGVGDGLGGLRLVRGRDPDVHHAVDRRHPRQPLAVGAQLRTGLDRVAEQCGTRDQRRVAHGDGGLAGVGGVRDGRQRGGERQGQRKQKRRTGHASLGRMERPAA